MVQLYTECPNCGSRLFYVTSLVTPEIKGERSLHYCNRCGYHNDFGKLEKSMIYA